MPKKLVGSVVGVVVVVVSVVTVSIIVMRGISTVEWIVPARAIVGIIPRVVVVVSP